MPLLIPLYYKNLKMLENTKEFNQLLIDIKERIKNSQLKALSAVNKELINLY